MFAAIALLTAAVCWAPASRALSADAPAGTRITDVAVRDRGGDATVVVVTFDGPVAGHRHFHMDGEAPRALLRIAGIVEAYRPYEVRVDDGRVLRVRIGHHPEADPPEEHLVFDLVDGGVAITRVVEQGEGLTVVLERVASSVSARPAAAPVPTPTPLRPTVPPPTPTPTWTVIPTATAPPPATAAPTLAPPSPTPTVASPTATPTPPAPRRPSREVPPTPPPPTVAATTGPRPPSPVPRLPGFSGSLLSELVIAHRDDGSAVVRVSVDGTLEGRDVRYASVRGAPPRHVLSLSGVGLPGEGAVLPVRDGLLCEVQVVFRGDAQPARTEVILFLASPAVAADRAAVKGAHAVVQLLPAADPGAPLECEVEARSGTRGWRFTTGGPPQALP